MIQITLFDNDWYSNIINQTKDSFSEATSADGFAMATSILVAGCCIAQAIDNAMTNPRSGDSLHDCFNGIDRSLSDIAEALREHND